MIHRDLKPANLMIVDPDTPRERIKVMDFGLAKLIENSSADRRVTDTTIDFAVGTPGYICPEQVRGEAMDHRGDLYSVGVMLYELLTGRLPFVGATSMDVLLAHVTEDPPRFADVIPDRKIPAGIEEVVRWCLAKDPTDRPQSARELAERYTAVLERSHARALAEAHVAALANGNGRTAVVDESDLVLLAQTATETPAASNTPRPATLTSETNSPPNIKDRAGLPYHLEAWMPESIAVMKLRGFVRDCNGDVLESTPGYIRVRLGKANSSGAFSWLGFGRRADGPIDMELHLHKIDPTRDKLAIDILFYPSHPSLLGDEVWQQRCSELFIQLRAYLMGAA
jgi:serine/threonine-protein kinase